MRFKQWENSSREKIFRFMQKVMSASCALMYIADAKIYSAFFLINKKTEI